MSTTSASTGPNAAQSTIFTTAIDGPHAAIPGTSSSIAIMPPGSPGSPGPSASGGAGTSGSDLLLTGLLSGAVIAAAVAAMVNLVLSRRKSLEDERARVRTTCAEAFEAVARYKEFPYAIRRRRNDTAAEERVRLSDELRGLQARLSYFTAWMRGEDADLSTAFDDLVRNLRRTAGGACHDAWLTPPAQSDADMNSAPGVVDLSDLTMYEDAYIDAVSNHLDALIKTRRIFRLRRS